MKRPPQLSVPPLQLMHVTLFALTWQEGACGAVVTTSADTKPDAEVFMSLH